jgi:polysaccharide export outer membrane protein
MSLSKMFLYGGLSMFFVFLSGCVSYDPHAIDAWVKAEKTNLAPDGYILEPADTIEVLASKVPELNLQKQMIRPDGKVFFESVGEIEAAGKTPKELADTIRERLLLLYALAGDNPVAINVYKLDSRVYYVLGEVHYPGPRPCTGRDSALRAIAETKPTVLAWRERVQVIRPSSDPAVKPKIFELNWGKMAASGDTTKDVLLEEGDIVYVPPTVVASIGKKVAEFVTPIGQAFATVNIVPAAPASRY